MRQFGAHAAAQSIKRFAHAVAQTIAGARHAFVQHIAVIGQGLMHALALPRQATMKFRQRFFLLFLDFRDQRLQHLLLRA